MFLLQHLPNELLSLVGEALESDGDQQGLYCLIRSNRRFAEIFTRNLNSLAVRFPERVKPEGNALERAIMCGNIDLAMLALKHCTPQTLQNYRNIALHWAAASEFTSREIITCLLENGAELEPSNPNCLTPLHIAAFYGRSLAALILLENGANPKSKGPIGNQQPLYVAVGRGHKGVVQVLLAYQTTVCLSGMGLYGQNVMHLATKYPSILKIMLKRGGKYMLTETDYLSPIHWAVRDNHTISTKILIEAGADIETQCPQGLTPLHLAIMWKQIECVLVLLKNGADITKLSKYKKTNGYTAIHLAVVGGSCTIVGTLLEYGANIDSCTEDTKQTSLHLATLIGDNDMVQYLLDHGININSRDAGGMTALHYAVKDGYASMIDQLIRNGADVTIQDTRGRTALQFAPDSWWGMSKPLRRSISLLRKAQFKTLSLQKDPKSKQGNPPYNRKLLLVESAIYLFGRTIKNT